MIIFFITYLAISFILFLICAKISYKFNLLDIPNQRKLHAHPTAYTGGIVLSLIYLLSLKLFNFNSANLSLIVSLSFLISIVGLIDDKFKLNIGGKLSLQILPIFYLIFIEKIYLNDIGDYTYFKTDLESFSGPFSLLCVLFLINAFNYFDGIDGSLSFTTISVIAIIYFLVPEINDKLFLITILLPIVIFLCFNFSLFNLPKLFLGDSGSLMLGFLISLILIYFANEKIIHPILLAWSVVIFVYEFLSLNITRIIKKKNIFNAGLDHLHHKLYKKTNSILFTNFYLMLMNICLFLIGYSTFVFINPLASLIMFVSLFPIFYKIRKSYLNI